MHYFDRMVRAFCKNCGYSWLERPFRKNGYDGCPKCESSNLKILEVYLAMEVKK